MAVEGRAHLRRFRLFLASNGTAEPSALNQGKTANRAYTRKKKMEVDVPYPSIEQVEYIKRVEQIIKDTEQGIVTANYQTGHPHGYISAMYRGELAISKIQYANDENFYEFKKQAERYPTALKKGLTEFFMFEAGFSLMFAENNIDKDDVSYVCGHCFRKHIFP